MICNKPEKISAAKFFSVSYDLPAKKRREKTTSMGKRPYEHFKLSNSIKEHTCPTVHPDIRNEWLPLKKA
jgi:hypothetical protein